MKKLIVVILLCFNYVSAQTICDSVSYTVSNSSTLTLIGDNHSSSELIFMWGVCDATACYSADTDTAYFPQVNIFDTVKACYNLAPVWTCNTCVYVIFVNGSWVVIDNVTSIHEITNKRNNGKAYDLLGRELESIYTGKMYIRDNRLYINNFLTH